MNLMGAPLLWLERDVGIAATRAMSFARTHWHTFAAMQLPMDAE